MSNERALVMHAIQVQGRRISMHKKTMHNLLHATFKRREFTTLSVQSDVIYFQSVVLFCHAPQELANKAQTFTKMAAGTSNLQYNDQTHHRIHL